MRTKEIVGTWRTVFGNWKYLIMAIGIAISFYIFNVLMANGKSIISFYSSYGLFQATHIFWTFIIGFGSTIKLHSFISLLTISVLFGMLFSLIVFKTRAAKLKSGTKVGVAGTSGLFLGALAPGCAACGVGLASAFGFSAAAFTFLPFEGLELSIAAIGLLSFSLIKTSKDLSNCDACQIKLRK